MRLLLLNYEFPPLGGGAGNATFYLVREFLQYTDLQIDLITSSADKYKEKKFSENIKIYFLDIGKRNRSLHYQTNRDLLTYAYKSYLFCKKLLKRNRYDLCHAFFGIPCGSVAMKLKIPYIVSLRGSDVPFHNQRFYWLDKIFFKRLSKKIWQNASEVIALSNDLKKLARKTNSDIDIKVIYNGVDCDEFYPDKQTLDLEKLKKQKIINVLFIGRLTKIKGIVYLLRAFKELVKKHKDTKLLIVGEGPLKNGLFKYCSDNNINVNVRFYGIIPHNKINRIYQKSHIFILPSLNEALGNVTHEAMASGLPIITTDTGAAELIDGNGFIVRKKDPQAISQKLQEFLQNRQLIVQMGKKSREIALKMNWRNAAIKYYKLYTEVMQ